jgi:hypothetical protein
LFPFSLPSPSPPVTPSSPLPPLPLLQYKEAEKAYKEVIAEAEKVKCVSLSHKSFFLSFRFLKKIKNAQIEGQVHPHTGKICTSLQQMHIFLFFPLQKCIN